MTKGELAKQSAVSLQIQEFIVGQSMSAEAARELTEIFGGFVSDMFTMSAERRHAELRRIATDHSEEGDAIRRAMFARTLPS